MNFKNLWEQLSELNEGQLHKLSEGLSTVHTDDDRVPDVNLQPAVDGEPDLATWDIFDDLVSTAIFFGGSTDCYENVDGQLIYELTVEEDVSKYVFNGDNENVDYEDTAVHYLTENTLSNLNKTMYFCAVGRTDKARSSLESCYSKQSLAKFGTSYDAAKFILIYTTGSASVYTTEKEDRFGDVHDAAESVIAEVHFYFIAK